MSRRNIEASEERGVDRLATYATRWIKIIALLIGLTITFLELKKAPLERFTQTFDNAALMKIGLVIFFFGWLWGATHDTEIQKRGYRRDPKRGEVKAKEIAGILIFMGVFWGLFWLHDRLVFFQAALLLFILVNTWTWRIIIDRTTPMIEASYQEFATDADGRDNAALAKLLIVVQYMNGRWQRSRFALLIVFAAVQLAAAFLVENGALQAAVPAIVINGVPAAVLIGYLPGTLFILYVLVSEIWMKVYRIKVFADLNTIDYLDEHFAISKRRDAALPTPHLAGLFDLSPPGHENYVGKGPVGWFVDVT